MYPNEKLIVMVTYSNERFFQLSESEIERQQNILLPLRDRHERELFATGTLDRVMGSLAITNRWADKTALNEGSLIYPFRSIAGSLMVSKLIDICHDVGMGNKIYEIVTRQPGGPDLFDSSVLHIGRIDAVEGGFNASSYVAGLIPHEEMNVSEYLPFPGVKNDDLGLMRQQLSEIQAFAKENNLTIIDPVTLTEGEGEVRLF